MLQLWKEGQAIIYDWIQFLQYDALSAIGISDNTLDLSWAFPSTDESKPDLLAFFKNSCICCMYC